MLFAPRLIIFCQMNQYNERIEMLRSFMRSRQIDAVVIFGSDPHLSEYPSPRWQQVKFLTGFTGEAADVVITLDYAGLWTDSRYFIQAESQLDGTNVGLHKYGIQVGIKDYLVETLGEGASVAIDSLCTSVSRYKELVSYFDVIRIPDILNVIWEDRPIAAQTSIFCFNAGESREDKLAWLRMQMDAQASDWFFIAALDEIAWLLNIRASDIEYNPFSISYLLVGKENAFWFVLRDEEYDDITSNSFSSLVSDGVKICPYDEVEVELASIEDGTIWIDEDAMNAELYASIKCGIHSAPSPIQARKAVKNALEIENMKEIHLKDGVAVENFLYWLETSLENGIEISEWKAAKKLGEFRAQIEDYQGDSFETISAMGENAALPHYQTPCFNAPIIKRDGLYLNDSGGQFLSGTTDITRTIPIGHCSPLERRDYTLVLKAHIDLASAIFPEGTPGCRVDAAARLPLWRNRLDFGHGTGHGVGYFLGVHEGPAQIRQNLNGAPLMEGMIMSIEPGVYRQGQFGIRHENLYLIRSAGQSQFGRFLSFEPLTMCHFDTSLIELNLLDKWEIEWLNDYNRRVFENLGPFLGKEVFEWLEQKTMPLCLE